MTGTGHHDTPRLTYRDLLRLPEDGTRHEIVDGAHWVSPSPSTDHQLILGNLYFLIRDHVNRHAGGVVLMAPFDVVFSMLDVVVPDLIYLGPASAGRLTRRNLRGAPDLAVEIASPGTYRRDDRVKLRLYERFAVGEYWTVDPAANLVRVYRRERARLVRIETLSRGSNAAIATPLLPGLRLPLDRIFTRPC